MIPEILSCGNRAAQRETLPIGHAAVGQELWLLVRCLFPCRAQYRGIPFVAHDDTVETLQLFKLLHRHAEFLDLHRSCVCQQLSLRFRFAVVARKTVVGNTGILSG